MVDTRMSKVYTLRDPYQTGAVNSAFDYFDAGGTSGVICIGTAGGKTVVGSTIIKEALTKGWQVLWAVHTKELIIGAFNTIQESTGLDDYQLSAEKADWKAEIGSKVVVASIQTLQQPGRFQRFKEWFHPKLIIIDEGHRAEAASYRKVFKEFGVFDGDCHGILLTATPFRSDKVQLFAEDIEGNAVTVRDIVTRKMRPATYQDTIAQKLLCNYDYAYLLHESWVVDCEIVDIKTQTDISDVPIGANSEYNQDKLKLKISHPARSMPILNDWNMAYSDMSTMVFCADVAHAHRTAEQIRSKFGIEAVGMDGETDQVLRTRDWQRFQRGELPVITTKGLFTEGADAWRCACVVNLCPNANLLPYVQKCGRAFRPQPGTVENTTSIEERLRNIAASEKPKAVIINAIDKDRRKHSLVRAPQIIGLPSSIDMAGLTMRQALERTYEFTAEQKERAAEEMPETLAQFRAILVKDRGKQRAASKPKPDWRSTKEGLRYAPLSQGGYTVEIHRKDGVDTAVVGYKGAVLKSIDVTNKGADLNRRMEIVCEGSAKIIADHKANMPRGTVAQLSSRQLWILSCAGYADHAEIDRWPLGKAMGIIASQCKKYARAKAAEESST